jgi:hypothetical protein
MARGSRDYQAEYARRIARNLAQGLTRSQARGHPRASERHLSARMTTPYYDRHLEEGLKAIRKGKPLTTAAHSLHVAPERLRAYIRQTGVVQKQGGRWHVVNDQRLRVVPVHSGGKTQEITVAGYERSAHVGRYMTAVKHFLKSNDPQDLAPYIGDGVADIHGRIYIFETRPNVLYRLRLTHTASFEQVYRIIA